ncbi:hypothetical protein, partial [Bradyrhizobium sp.]|uniref:hypothetical protein n=1 Tax=Bradyrhizobium sp. TaxID=376 RepID=UPI003C70783F
GTSERSNFCSEARHTAREHPIQAKILYPFHPRCGETVLVRRRLLNHDVEHVVIVQPDGSLAHLPAWMLNEAAARFTISDAPRFPVEILLSMRVAIDALLTSLSSESTMETEGYEPMYQKSRTPRSRSVRNRATARDVAASPKAATDCTGGSPAGRDRRDTGNRGGRR